MANFYATLADNGLYQELGYIRQITNAAGTTIYERDIDSYEVLDPQTAYIVNDILADPDFKPAGLRGRSNLAFKSSNPENDKEGFFFAYTPAGVLAGWVGKQAAEAGGGSDTVAAQTLLVNDFLQGYDGDGRQWPRPGGLRTLNVDPLSGKPGSGPADLFPSGYATDSEPLAIRVDRVSGQLAGACTPESALMELTSRALRAELPADDPAYHDWLRPVWVNLGSRLDGSVPSQIDSLHACDDRPPSLSVDKSGNCQRNCRLTVKATAGTHGLQAIIIKANREGVQDVRRPISGREAEVSYTYSNQESDARNLRIEVVDEALYSDSLTIDL